jgi:hypothetical protein
MLYERRKPQYKHQLKNKVNFKQVYWPSMMCSKPENKRRLHNKGHERPLAIPVVHHLEHYTV